MNPMHSAGTLKREFFEECLISDWVTSYFNLSKSKFRTQFALTDCFSLRHFVIGFQMMEIGEHCKLQFVTPDRFRL